MPANAMRQRERDGADAAPREYLSTRQAAELLELAEVTLALWRRQGRGPAFIRLGNRIRYDRRDLETWLAAHRVTPGSAT